jgi:hypothetical protein
MSMSERFESVKESLDRVERELSEEREGRQDKIAEMETLHQEQRKVCG